MAVNPEEYYQRKRHHHHHRRRSDQWSWQRFQLTWVRDKKMIIGIILTLIAACVFLFGPFRKEFVEDMETLKLLIIGAPDEEIEVDVLNINPEQQEAKMRRADSIASAQQVDSLRQQVKNTDRVPVYRPPKDNRAWYLTGEEIKGTYDRVRRSGK